MPHVTYAGGFFLTVPPHFQYQNGKKNLLSQRGAFLHLIFFLKGSPSWLQIVFHFGTENLKEQLKSHPVYHTCHMSHMSHVLGWDKADRAQATEVEPSLSLRR